MKKHIGIKYVFAREVLNAKGMPTLEVEVETETGRYGKAMVPTSDGTRSEFIMELRDNDKRRFHGQGVLNAVHNVNQIIAKELVGMNVFDQLTIDQYLNYLDGTKNKASLGANALLGVSMAVAKAAANSVKLPLYSYIGGISGTTIPYPMVSLFKNTEENASFKEVMIVPKNVDLFADRIRMCAEVKNGLKTILNAQEDKKMQCDDGVVHSNFKHIEEILESIMESCKNCGYKDELEILLVVNHEQSYQEKFSDYPVSFIEDASLTRNHEDWKRTIESRRHQENQMKHHFSNCLVIKPNEVGTISEMIDVIKFSKANGVTPILSRSAVETEDSFFADFSVALNLKYVQFGPLCHSENMAKYNRLLKIEEEVHHSDVEDFSQLGRS